MAHRPTQSDNFICLLCGLIFLLFSAAIFARFESQQGDFINTGLW